MLGHLQLQQLADSAFPIGSASHSFGLESLVDAGFLRVENLAGFLEVYLAESGVLEAAYCRASYGAILDDWLALNVDLGARKPARESRDASAAMGRRFLRLAAAVSDHPSLREASQAEAEVHLAPCFGFVAGTLGIDATTAAEAYLQQSMTALISACQRLLPLGQTQAHRILWDLKPSIVRAAKAACATPPPQVSCFTPLVDLASARHASLYTRLFMS